MREEKKETCCCFLKIWNRIQVQHQTNCLQGQVIKKRKTNMSWVNVVKNEFLGNIQMMAHPHFNTHLNYVKLLLWTFSMTRWEIVKTEMILNSQLIWLKFWKLQLETTGMSQSYNVSSFMCQQIDEPLCLTECFPLTSLVCCKVE